MTTGIIAAMAGIGSVSYTPNTPTKISLSWVAGAGNITLNGVNIANGTSPGLLTHFVGANQTVTVATTAAAGTFVLSALESYA